MKIIRRQFKNDSRSAVYKIVPIGDVHTGAAACDEDRLRRVVKRIQEDPNYWWIGMGDYCDFINMKDPRFSVETLAPWIGTRDLAHIAQAQSNRFLDIMKPIANKCLAMVKGNHEESIQHHYENDVYTTIVDRIKEYGGFKQDDQMGVGYYGWLMLNFERQKQKCMIDINLHHGYVGGKLAGAKALEMQRWLWSHEADIVIFGHSHNTAVQVEQVEGVTRTGELVLRKRYGCYSGTFLRSMNEGSPSTYSEIKGYLPMPTSGVEIWITPGKDSRDVIRIITGID